MLFSRGGGAGRLRLCDIKNRPVATLTLNDEEATYIKDGNA